jgi:hypothetical protein
MELKFTAEDHKYETVNDPTKKWISATGILKVLTEPFDQEAVATKSSKNKRSKWFGLTSERIIEIWTKEAKRATDLGSWYHDQRETDLLACSTVQREGLDLSIVHPILDGDIKFAPDQQIVPGIYPEHFVYLKSALICGQADRVEVVGNKVNVYDYKTNKKMREAYTNWEGNTKKMLGPISHVDDSDLMHYALQLSIYMYVILKHNHTLEPGKLEISHIMFEVESIDEFGFPTSAIDAAGDPIIKEIVPYELPYLKKEVMAMIKYIKMNSKEFGR